MKTDTVTRLCRINITFLVMSIFIAILICGYYYFVLLPVSPTVEQYQNALGAINIITNVDDLRALTTRSYEIINILHRIMFKGILALLLILALCVYLSLRNLWLLNTLIKPGSSVTPD